jgi:hypothetical protein
MSTATESKEVPRINAENGRLVIPVPWNRAEGLLNRLRSQGIGSTLCLVPYVEEARIEVSPGTDVAAVQAALDLAGT